MDAKAVTAGDIRIAYDESGAADAAPVVLVHGIAQDAASWRPVLAECAAPDGLPRRHCFAPDVRGHGGTDLGSADGTLDQLAADLCGFLEAVTGPAACVGFSLGGTITLAAALARPDLVPRLVLMGTSSVVGRAAAEFFEQRATVADSAAADPAALAAAIREDTLTGLHGSHDEAAIDAIVAQRLRAIGAGGGFANACRAMMGLAARPLTPELPRITVPVTVIGAENDPMCPRKASDILLAGLSDARYVEIAASSHLMAIDQPVAVGVAVRDALHG